MNKNEQFQADEDKPLFTETLPKQEGLQQIEFIGVTEKEDQDQVNYKIYNYSLPDGKRASVVFKNEEQLPEFNDLNPNSEIIMIGNLPYARSDEAVKKYHTHYLQQAGLRHGGLTRSVDAKYPFDVNIEFDTIYSAKENYGGLVLEELEKIDVIETDSSPEMLIVNTDIASVIEAAKHLKEKVGEHADLDFSPIELARIEDLVVLLSLDEKGKIKPRINEIRYKIFNALLKGKDEVFSLKREVVANNLLPYQICEADRYLENKRRTILSEVDYVENTLGDPIRNSPYSRDEALKRVNQTLENSEKVQEFSDNYFKTGKVEYPLSFEDIEKLNEHVVIHMTKYPPKLDSTSGQYYIPTTHHATDGKLGRLSLHFAVDTVAVAAMVGTNNWGEYPYAVVCPLGEMVRLNGPMAQSNTVDTWWLVDPTESKGVLLPLDTTVVVNSPETEDDFKLDNPLISKHHLQKDESLDQFVKKEYGVTFKQAGNRGWGDDFEQTLFMREIHKLFPHVSSSIHMDTVPQSFEDQMLGFYASIIKRDHKDDIESLLTSKKDNPSYSSYRQKEYLRYLFEKTAGQNIERLGIYHISDLNKEFERNYGGSIPREFGHYLVKLGLV